MERTPWKVFYEEKSFEKSSRSFLWRERFPKVFYGEKTFQNCFVERTTLNFFLRREELQRDFYRGNYFKKSSTERRPSKGLLKKERGFVSF